MSRSLLLALLAICTPALAEQKQVLGEHVVHYSAQNASELSPEVARRHGISRQPGLALVMLTVQKQTGEAVSARIRGQTRNLLGQTQILDLRELREGASVYYLGLFSISNRDTQTFEFEIAPENGTVLYPLRFSQQFFRD